MNIIISLTALLISVLFVQLGSGSLGPLDVLSGTILEFSSIEIGLIGSAHFLGFIIGCFITPFLIVRVGHSRTFAVLASTGAISALMHMILPDPFWWILLRVMTGISIAGAHTVMEIWIQPKLTNKNRGSITGFYRLVDILGNLIAQAMIAALEPATFVAYNIIAIMCCLSILPLSLTTSMPPLTPKTIKLRPFMIFHFSPLAALGVLVAGLSGSIFRMMGALYASRIGLTKNEIALFLVFGVLGGAISQVPAGYIADRMDRRYVLIGFSSLACFTCLFLSLYVVNNILWLYLGIFSFGFASFPIYSLSSAHANDFASNEEMVELNSALIFTFAIGAIVSPFISGALINILGPKSIFVLIGLSHLILIFYGLYRMGIRPTLTERTAYTYLPRTSAIIAWFVKHKDDGEN